MSKNRKGTMRFKKCALPLVGVLFVIVLVGYFLNIIFFQNKPDIFSVVILDSLSDTSEFENELSQFLRVDEEQKISVKVLDPKVEANQAILMTWMRAKTVDVIIGEDDVIIPYAQRGFLKNVDEFGIEKEQEALFQCGLVEFDNDGNEISTGGEQPFGVYADFIYGLEIQNGVVGVLVNSPNEKNAENVMKKIVE